MSTLKIEYCRNRAEAEARAQAITKAIKTINPGAKVRPEYADGIKEAGITNIEIYQTPDLNKGPVTPPTIIIPNKLDTEEGVVLMIWQTE